MHQVVHKHQDTGSRASTLRNKKPRSSTNPPPRTRRLPQRGGVWLLRRRGLRATRWSPPEPALRHLGCPRQENSTFPSCTRVQSSTNCPSPFSNVFLPQSLKRNIKQNHRGETISVFSDLRCLWRGWDERRGPEAAPPRRLLLRSVHGKDEASLRLASNSQSVSGCPASLPALLLRDRHLAVHRPGDSPWALGKGGSWCR